MSNRKRLRPTRRLATCDTDYPVDALTHASLGQSVYKLLRQSLASGRFRPDAKLRIRELAMQFGTSVTPVRDAILQLASEEAILLRSPRDIRVPMPTIEKFLEIRSLRIELEGLAAATAAMQIDGAGLAHVEQLIESNRRAVDAGDMALAFRLNQRFHLALADAAGMPCLRGFIDNLWVQTAPLLASAYQSSSEIARVDDHEEIVSALRNRDSDGARKRMRDHIVEGSEYALRYIRDRHVPGDRVRPSRIASSQT